MLPWIFILSISMTSVGGWLYLYEVIQGRVDLRTRWSDLDETQWTAVILVGVGIVGLVASLALGVLSR